MPVSINRATGAVRCADCRSADCDHVLRLSHALARTSVSMALDGRGRGGDIGAAALLLDSALASAERPRAADPDERPLSHEEHPLSTPAPFETMTRIVAAARAAGASRLTQSQREDYLRAEAELVAARGVDVSSAPESILDRHAWWADAPADRSGLPAGALPTGGTGLEPGGDAAAYERAFDAYIRRGVASLPHEQREILQTGFREVEGRALNADAAETRALSSITGSAGGFTVPDGFYSRIVEAMKAFGGIRGAGITVVRTDSGNDIPVPQSDDTANEGALIAENTAATEQDVAFTQALFKAHTFTSKIVRVPNQLLQDSGFDMDRFVTRTLARRIARAEAGYFVTGTGVSQPEGILANVATGHTAASATDVTYGELVELQYSVDPGYRAAGEWLISDGAAKVLAGKTDADGKPLYPELANGTLLGRPVTVDVGLPAPAIGTKPILFGDLSGFAVRDVAGLVVMRLSERYAEYNQTGFILWHRTDSRKITSDSTYKALTMAAA